MVSGRREAEVGDWEEKYEAEARVMEKGYSLKSLVVATRIEACLRADGFKE